MNKKKNLLNLFTQDASYNYHIVKTSEPDGHLIYLIKNGSELTTETLEFAPTKIAEELIQDCGVQIEKFAPAIFFTEEANSAKLKYELDDKLSQTAEFSAFVETIKDEYRILEVKDSLLFKKDPESYEKTKREEYQQHQKELWDEMLEQLNEKKKKREEAILVYENDLIKLMKEYFEGIIEYEKRDFNFDIEFEKFLGNFIDPETWIKINDKPFICRAEIISLGKDRMNVFLTDNNDYSYTATIKFDKTVFITENVIKIEKGGILPVCMTDYEVVAKLYDVDFSNVKDWEFKNHTDRFEYVIDYLVPIFKENKIKKEKEIIDKVIREEGKMEDDGIDVNNEITNSDATPDKYMFDVFIPEDSEINSSSIALVKIDFWNQNHCLDDSLGSHNLPKNVRKALKRAGIYGDVELMESIWEVIDNSRTKENIIEIMKQEGFVYNPNLF